MTQLEKRFLHFEYKSDDSFHSFPLRSSLFGFVAGGHVHSSGIKDARWEACEIRWDFFLLRQQNKSRMRMSKMQKKIWYKIRAERIKCGRWKNIMRTEFAVYVSFCNHIIKFYWGFKSAWVTSHWEVLTESRNQTEIYSTQTQRHNLTNNSQKALIMMKNLLSLLKWAVPTLNYRQRQLKIEIEMAKKGQRRLKTVIIIREKFLAHFNFDFSHLIIAPLLMTIAVKRGRRKDDERKL